jgi:hypothetical protein
MNQQQIAESIANLSYRLNLLTSEMTLIMEDLRRLASVQEEVKSER